MTRGSSLFALILVVATGCASAVNEEDATGVTSEALTSQQAEGKKLFNQETFNGNGRTCASCHSAATGTLNPAQVEALYQSNPNDPFFQHDAADAEGSGTFNRVRSRATISIELPLPANVSIVGSSARTVIVNRAIPTTMNTPALDTVLMSDGRAPSLQAQALGAINGHAQATDVSSSQLDSIAVFEKTLFNDGRVKNYAEKGVPLDLPKGTTDAEKRGRLWFTDDNPANGNPVKGRCVHCHSGPMLNQTSPGFQMITGVPAHSRFFTAFVSEFNPAGDPQKTFRFTNADGSTTDVVSADPGLALQTGDPGTAGLFKIPSVWGSKNTAPYFHDNSAKDVDALLKHYQNYFHAVGFELLDSDLPDIKAYMALL